MKHTSTSESVATDCASSAAFAGVAGGFVLAVACSGPPRPRPRPAPSWPPPPPRPRPRPLPLPFPRPPPLALDSFRCVEPAWSAMAVSGGGLARRGILSVLAAVVARAGRCMLLFCRKGKNSDPGEEPPLRICRVFAWSGLSGGSEESSASWRKILNSGTSHVVCQQVANCCGRRRRAGSIHNSSLSRAVGPLLVGEPQVCHPASPGVAQELDHPSPQGRGLVSLME